MSEISTDDLPSPSFDVGVCPCCKVKIDGHTGITDKKALPKPGDFTICSYCRQVLVYRVGPTACGMVVTPATDAEMAEFIAIPGMVRAMQVMAHSGPGRDMANRRSVNLIRDARGRHR